MTEELAKYSFSTTEPVIAKTWMYGIEMMSALEEIYNFCRSQIKHCEHTEEVYALFEQIQALTIGPWRE